MKVQGAELRLSTRWPWLACAALAAAAWVALGSCKDSTTIVGAGGQGGDGVAGSQGGNGAEGGSGGQGGYEAPPDYVAACEGYAAKFCGGVFTCSGPIWTHFEGTEENCVARTAEFCQALYRPGSSAAALNACTAALPEDCMALDRMVWRYFESPPGLAGPNEPEECFFKGSQPDGSGCQLSSECQSGFCNYPEEGDYCGTCTQPLGLNDPCTWNCGRGLWCIDSHCVPLREEGESCDNQSELCHVDLFCNEGTCAPARIEQDPCAPEQDTCRPYGSVWCSPDVGSPDAGSPDAGSETYSCQAAETDVPVDGACGWLADGPFQLCAHPSICRAEPGTSAGSCVASAGEGQPCEESQDYLFYWSNCGTDLACVADEDGGGTYSCQKPTPEPCP